MAYSDAAKERRRCLGTRADGQPCRNYAVWNTDRQLCAQHAGRAHVGPRYGWRQREWKTKYIPCTCQAYAWPHRPGSGICRWPEAPHFRCTTPAGTHAWPRASADERALMRTIERRRRNRHSVAAEK